MRVIQYVEKNVSRPAHISTEQRLLQRQGGLGPTVPSMLILRNECGEQEWWCASSTSSGSVTWHDMICFGHSWYFRCNIFIWSPSSGVKALKNFQSHKHETSNGALHAQCIAYLNWMAIWNLVAGWGYSFYLLVANNYRPAKVKNLFHCVELFMHCALK